MSQTYAENAHGVYILDGDGNIIGDEDNPQSSRIDREGDTTEVTITGFLSQAFYIGDKAGFGIQFPAGMTICAIGVHVAATENGAYQPFYDETDPNTPHQIGDGTKNISGKSFTFPAEVFPWPWIKLWSQNGSGVNVSQVSARLCTIVRKS